MGLLAKAADHLEISHLRTIDVRSRLSIVVESLRRPYPLSTSLVIPMVLLMSLIPFYVFIGDLAIPGRRLHVPELALDRLIPLRPIWVLVYGSLYLFALLPVVVVRQQEQMRRTILAWLMVWIVAYICFLIYPTLSPRPAKFIGAGFFAWGLRNIYAADVPYNCFPCLHVAHSVISAMTCYRVHRGLGIGATFWAMLIGVSTLFTKQHYVLDVLAGILLAYIAYLIFLRSYKGEEIQEIDRRAAPVIGMCFVAFHALLMGCFWVAYLLRGHS